MILYSRIGIFDTKKSGLLTFSDEPGRIRIVRGSHYANPGTLYTSAEGVDLELAGNYEGARRYQVAEADLLAADWGTRYETSTGRKQREELRARQEAEREAHEAELIRRMKKNGSYELYESQRREQYRDYYGQNSSWAISFDNTILSHILPNIHKGGYYLTDYDANHPNAKYRLINRDTEEWDDAGICAGNNGVWSLYDLAELFGDPWAGDPLRQVKHPETGKVLGANPTFDKALTQPTAPII